MQILLSLAGDGDRNTHSIVNNFSLGVSAVEVFHQRDE